MPSNAAKAAAILVFTSGIDGFHEAVRVYDELENDDLPVSQTLDKFPEVTRWSVVDGLDDFSWWDEITQLATNIDAAREIVS
jgi:hypothetical protein